MAAGQGFKTFTTGEVLTAADVNGYLMQGVLVFATEAARNAAITSPQEGQFAFTKDNNSLWYYTGSAWAASGATGDIEGVTAGVGISGGGTSGTVTITNSMATAIDAKGDLVVGTAADTFSRLAVGTNGYTLVADSAETTGLKWAAASSSLVGCMLRKSADQTISTSTFTAVTFDTEIFDTDSFHSTTTNTSRITIPSGKGGKYVVYAGLEYLANANNSRRLNVVKNGISVGPGVAYQKTGGFSGAPSNIVYVGMENFTAGEYVEAFAWQDSGGNLDVEGDTAGGCWFGVQYLGA